jgi:hypothetical protein
MARFPTMHWYVVEVVKGEKKAWYDFESWSDDAAKKHAATLSEGAPHRVFPAVHLIDMGRVPGKRASEIKVGDVLRFNYGSKSVVEAIRQEKGFIYFTTRHTHGGFGIAAKPEEQKTYEIRKKASTLVPVDFTSVGEAL